MGEWFPANISIGGKLHRSRLKDLSDCLLQDGVMDYEEEEWSLADIQAVLEHDSKQRFVARFTNIEAKYGVFEATEAYCIKNGLSFLRHNDAYNDYEAEYEWWNPGMEKTATCPSNNDGEVFVRSELLTKILTSKQSAKEMIKEIGEYVVTHPPSIPHLELVE